MAGRDDRRPVPLPSRDRDPLGYGRSHRGYASERALEAEQRPARDEAPTDFRDDERGDWQTGSAETTYSTFKEPPAEERSSAELYAEPPSDKVTGEAPIVPAGSVTGRSLTLVISIMCFLASLTAGAVYLMNQSAQAWMANVASEVTVQVEPRDGYDTQETLTRVKNFLDIQSGIANAEILAVETSRALLEPWLGAASALEDLPIPRLIAVQIDRSNPADLDRVRSNLAEVFKDERVSLDDHRRWQQQIRAVTRSFALGGLAILLLVGAATMAIIISATRSAMLSNREIVEVLNFIGATDRFIAREFERHFLALGIRAGLVGAAFATLVFILMPVVMHALGSGGSVTGAEVRRLVGSGTLDGPGYLLIGIVVIVIAALCMLTSRFGVYRILNSRT